MFVLQSGLRVKEFEEVLHFYSEMIGKISDLKMNKKQDHKSQLDDEKEGYSDQTERKQKDSNIRTIRDAFLQLLS